MLISNFVKTYMGDASQSALDTGTPVLVTLAQAALESGWGEHAPGNNFFGIKDSDRVNFGIQTKVTEEFIKGKEVHVQAKFEIFPTAYECFRFHGELLKVRFPKSFKYEDPIQFITSVQNDYSYKYATDPAYVDKITAIIKMIQKVILP
jgi:flagellum-specific peptidoglycan hydrolase FlgJ